MMPRSRVALTLTCFLLGVVLVAQLRGRRGESLPTRAIAADQSVLLGGLMVTNADLRREVRRLESEIESYQQTQERTVPQMMEDLDRMRRTNGTVGVVGGGVEVRVLGAVEAFSLQDLINEVRNTGAEAISLNGLRLTTRSSLAAGSWGIVVDGQPIAPPYVVQAIGDPATMATALNRRGGELQIMQARYPGLQVSVKAMVRLVLPAARKSGSFAFARPVE